MLQTEIVRQLISDYLSTKDDSTLDRLTGEVVREVEMYTYATIRDLVSKERQKIYLTRKQPE